MRLLRAWILSGVLSAWFLTGCGVAARSGAPPKLYEGTTLANDQVAVLDWGCSSCSGGSVKEVDRRKVEEVTRWDTRVAVLPGKHTLRYDGWYGGSVMLGPASRTITQTDVVELKAGHVYLVKATRKGQWSHPSLYLWIEDAATGEVVAGNVYRDLPAGSVQLVGPPRGPGVSVEGLIMLGVGEGSVWILTTKALVRLDTQLKAVTATFPITGMGLDVGEGAVWVLEREVIVPDRPPARSRHPGRVLRIDPTTGQVVATIELSGDARGIEIMEGAVWVQVPDGNLKSFSRIDPGTNKISATYPAPGSIDVGEGSMWIARANGTLSRIDLSSKQETASVPIGVRGERPGGLPGMRVAVGEGAVFVQNLKEPSFIRVDSQTNRVTTTTPLSARWLFSKPRSCTSARTMARRCAEGALWVAHDDHISAIDSRTGQVRATLQAPADWRQYVDLQVAEGAIWFVTDEGETTAFIRRIGLPEKQ